jgi:hypothetical protein
MATSIHNWSSSLQKHKWFNFRVQYSGLAV